MKRYFSRPDIQLLILAAVIFLLGLVPGRSKAIDIHLHDTYFVITLFVLCVVYAVLLVVEAGLYTASARFRQWRWLQIFHVLSMLTIPLLFIIDLVVEIKPEAGMPRRYYDYENIGPFDVYQQALPWIFSVMMLIFLAGQVAFLVNIIAGFVRGKRN